MYVDEAWGVKMADATKVRLGDWPLSWTWQNREALLPDDSVPAKGTAVRPGEHITIEVATQFPVRSIAVTLGSWGGNRIDALLGVTLNMRYSTVSSYDFQIGAGGQNITLRDK